MFIFYDERICCDDEAAQKKREETELSSEGEGKRERDDSVGGGRKEREEAEENSAFARGEKRRGSGEEGRDTPWGQPYRKEEARERELGSVVSLLSDLVCLGNE